MTCDLNSSGDDSLKTSGTKISSTLPVARSSSNSAGFMAISGTNPRDEKYGTASQALPWYIGSPSEIRSSLSNMQNIRLDGWWIVTMMVLPVCLIFFYILVYKPGSIYTGL
jgi:hypothetical protein